MRVLYQFPFDPNLATEELLNKLSNRGALRQDLASRPVVGLEELREVAGESSGFVEVEKLLEALLAAAKRRQFETVRDREFLLIDGEWSVELDGSDRVVLQLARLGTDESAIDMPVGVSLRVPTLINQRSEAPGVLVTPQGLQRLVPTERVTATVFGTGSFSTGDSALKVVPVVIFRRVGTPATSARNPDFE